MPTSACAFGLLGAGVMLLRLLLAPAVVVVGMKHAIPAVIPVDGGGTGASSGRQRSWIQIPR